MVSTVYYKAGRPKMHFNCSRLLHIAYKSSAYCRPIPQWRVQEFVRGVAENMKGFFLAFQFFKGGPAQKIVEKMIFPTKKVAK